MAPSVLLVREIVSFRPPDLTTIGLDNLEVLAPHLEAGAIAAFTTAGAPGPDTPTALKASTTGDRNDWPWGPWPRFSVGPSRHQSQHCRQPPA